MERNSRITQYRERLDSTLTSPELTHKEKLKLLIKDQLNYSSQCETRETSEALLEKRTMEVSDFLDMLRSASVNPHDAPKGSETARGSWKLKQDTEDLRVMYREGPHGSPLHTLLAEGYMDGPLDVCLCTNWESALYKKWWPQSTIPAFKIISSKCVQKIRTGEQIASVRMKVPWPLSSREAVVQYFEFEYFQDDLIVVLLNTIPDLESIDGTTHGLKKDGILEAKDVVRIDVMGGFVLQKVTAERSYFRTIANMDIKMDFVPSSLINFVSRQLIGSGFKLYQKVISSSFADDDYSRALEDPLYARIRQALYSDNQYNIALEQKELEKEICTLSEEHSVESLQNDLDLDGSVQTHGDASEYSLGDAEVKGSRTFGEIEEERAENSTIMEHCGKDNTQVPSNVIHRKYSAIGDRRAHISEEVQQALLMLDKAIYMIREYGCSAQTKYLTTLGDEECGRNIKDEAGKESSIHSSGEVQVGVPKKDVMERSAQTIGTMSCSLDSRRTVSNSCLGEKNHNKIVPASPQENHLNPRVFNHIDIANLENGTVEKLQSDDHKHHNKDMEVTGVNGDDAKSVKMKRHKMHWRCFPLSKFRS